MASTDAAALQELAVAISTGQQLCERLAAAVVDETNKDPSSASPSASTAEGEQEADSSSSSSPSPISLARDATTLIRAHATKLALLAINEPFTASAISDVLRQLLAAAAAAAASVPVCNPRLYIAVFYRELAWRLRRVLVALGQLLGTVGDKSRVLLSGTENGRAGRKGTGGGGGGGSSSLPATGILWSACDEVLELARMGVSGLLVEKMDEWKDTLADVMQELKDWGEEDEEDDDDGDDGSTTCSLDAEVERAVHNDTTNAQDILDKLMNTSHAIPTNDPHGIRPRLESTLRRIRLVISLFQAIKKRRLKTLPPLSSFTPPPTTTLTLTSSPNHALQRLDKAMAALGRLPDAFSQLAIVFYDMDPVAIDQAADDCFLDACAAGELLSTAWDDKRDEFSAWMERFRAEMKLSRAS